MAVAMEAVRPKRRLSGVAAEARLWSAEEDAVLREFYEVGGYKAVAEKLPGRTKQGIFRRAQVLKLYTHRRWTSVDDAQLRDLWDSGLSVHWIAKRLGRSQITTYWRAQKIGLPLGCPEGFEYLSAAAKRTGYDTSQIWRIMQWAKKPVRVSLGRPTKAARRFHIVETFDVDEAVEAWHQTEPLDTAARRVGVCAETLRRWLIAIGVKEPARKFRHHWRVAFTDVERAVSARGTLS